MCHLFLKKCSYKDKFSDFILNIATLNIHYYNAHYRFCQSYCLQQMFTIVYNNKFYKNYSSVAIRYLQVLSDFKFVKLLKTLDTFNHKNNHDANKSKIYCLQ